MKLFVCLLQLLNCLSAVASCTDLALQFRYLKSSGEIMGRVFLSPFENVLAWGSQRRTAEQASRGDLAKSRQEASRTTVLLTGVLLLCESCIRKQ